MHGRPLKRTNAGSFLPLSTAMHQCFTITHRGFFHRTTFLFKEGKKNHLSLLFQPEIFDISCHLKNTKISMSMHKYCFSLRHTKQRRLLIYNQVKCIIQKYDFCKACIEELTLFYHRCLNVYLNNGALVQDRPRISRSLKNLCRFAEKNF